MDQLFVVQEIHQRTPDSISVRLDNGERARSMDARTLISCQVGTRCMVFLSSARNVQIASSCSSFRDTILAKRYCVMSSVLTAAREY